MTASDPQLERRALAVVELAIDLRGEERKACLAAECAGDERLTRRVLALLALHETGADSTEQVQSRIQSNFDSMLPSDALSDISHVGPYRLQEQLGEGGMGAVYRAERADGAFERTVAVKFIRGRLHSSSVQQRFEAERRIMAGLQHPNITALLDGGDEGGQPYLVMEFVDGVPFGFDSTQPVRRQLRRFVKVCSAVAHAHGALILHRDIKPDNVLITTDGEPKLLDFGIAKLTLAVQEGDDLTGVGAAPMTVNYAAPELLAGEAASVASDVYALGVMLREVLTGERAYDVSGLPLLEARDTVESQAQNLAQTGSHDLDLIIATATHPDSSRRYASATALADDINRYLERRPISARGDDAAYVVGRFVRRNRLATLVGASSAVVIVGLLISTLIALADSERERLRAEDNASTADAAVGFLIETLSSANPLESLNPVTTIDEALAAADTSLDTAAGFDTSRLAYLRSALGQIYGGRGQPERALELVSWTEEVLADIPVAVRVQVLAFNAETLFRVGRYQEAANAAGGVLELAKDHEIDSSLISSVMGVRGEALISGGDYAAGDAQMRELIAWVTDHAPQDFMPLARAYNGLSNIESVQANFEAAADYMGQVLATLEAADELGSANGLQSMSNQAGLLAALKRFDDAETQYKKTTALMREQLGDSHPWLVWTTASYGLMYNHQGKPAEGVAIMRPLLPAVQSSFPQVDETRSYFEAKLGFTMCKAGEAAEGLSLLNASLNARRQIYPPGHWTIPDAQMAIGYCQAELGRVADARVTLEQAYDNFLAVHGAEHPSTTGVQQMLASLP
ncbi:MAG: serine/threonine-protein kinase [Pseudomonadaceae bacterium]|nr:serine/threonine-protein kinase [Pseudomonadaceae bacterium]